MLVCTREVSACRTYWRRDWRRDWHSHWRSIGKTVGLRCRRDSAVLETECEGCTQGSQNHNALTVQMRAHTDPFGVAPDFLKRKALGCLNVSRPMT